MKVERIGHGTRAVEDRRLLDYLAKNRVPLEVCPLSNVRTGVVSAIEEHPIRTFFERGLLFSVNTDDPKMFGNSLAQEYAVSMERFGSSPAGVRALIIQAIETSWLAPGEKQKLIASFEADGAWGGL